MMLECQPIKQNNHHNYRSIIMIITSIIFIAKYKFNHYYNELTLAHIWYNRDTSPRAPIYTTGGL